MAIVRTRQAPGCAHGPGCPHDIGPAAAGVGAAVNAMAAVEARVAEVPGSWMQHIVRGSGEVTTRKATAAELARLEPPDPVVPAAPVREGPAAPVREGPAIHVMRPAAAIAARSRQRGGERARQVYAGRAASRSAQRAIPATATSTGADALGPSRAVSGNLAARTEAPPDPVPVTPVTIEEDPVSAAATPPVPPAIPCGDCLHARVCKDRENVEGTDPREIIEVRPGLRMVVLRIHECDDYLAPTFEQSALEARVVALASVPEPAPVRREHGGESWRTKAEPDAEATPIGTVRVTSIEELDARVAAAPKRYPLPKDRAERDRVVLEAVRSTGSLAEAGEVLRVSEARVGQVLREIRLGGALPDDVATMIAARAVVKPKAATA